MRRRSMEGANNPSWRGGHAGYRGPSWTTQRQLCRDRDGARCVNCGSVDDLTVHHLIPFRAFGNHEEANALDNLAVYCRRCNTEADNAFWAAHPEMLQSARSSFPDCRIIRKCERCELPFEATPAAKVCLSCCTFDCDQCGTTFVSRRRRNVRFCSKQCNQNYRIERRTFPHACVVCGTKIRTGRYRCRDCHLKDPVSSVRPGRRIGRPPKDRSAA